MFVPETKPIFKVLFFVTNCNAQKDNTHLTVDMIWLANFSTPCGSYTPCKNNQM